MSEQSLETIRIEKVHFVEKVVRHRERTFKASSLSGHLIHFVIQGEVEQESNGIRQHLKAGDVVWYEPNSIIRGRVLKSPWAFFTVSFESSNLPFIPSDSRVVEVTSQDKAQFDQLHTLWLSRSYRGLEGGLELMSCLYKIVAMCYPNVATPVITSDVSSSWWTIESNYTQHIAEATPSLRTIATEQGITLKKLAEVCRKATGEAPKTRLRTVRMAHVKGFIISSDMTISEIAHKTGYSRVQDLSRACKKFFGMTPIQIRHAESQLKELPKS